MLFEITQNAASFYKSEFVLGEQEAIRLFVRGAEGFFLGVEKDEIDPSSFVVEIDGIRFFITENDQWHFDGRKLDFDPTTEMMILS